MTISFSVDMRPKTWSAYLFDGMIYEQKASGLLGTSVEIILQA